MNRSWRRGWAGLVRADEIVSSAALALMLIIPLAEMAARPSLGQGIDNASVLVQHLGLVLAMIGAIAAERNGHLTTLMVRDDRSATSPWRRRLRTFSNAGAALISAALAFASWRFVESEIPAGTTLAYGIPVWSFQAAMPLGFVLLSVRLASRCAEHAVLRWVCGILLPFAGVWVGAIDDGALLAQWPALVCLMMGLLAGAPIFAFLGGLALSLFSAEGLPIASVALSHYQITVNPSLPALPLFTLAGLIFARTGAAGRLGAVFVAMFGGGARASALATAVLCSIFTAFTGGSGVTILALGGLLLPLLQQAHYPERKAIGLITGASALGVLLAPSVPLIMYAVIARVPIQDMFVAGLLPACIMVACLLVMGGYLRLDKAQTDLATGNPGPVGHTVGLGQAVWNAKWELAAPWVAIGAMVSGLATPTESAALTAGYAVLTQSLAHRELQWRLLGKCLSDCTQLIGGVMLILGMALAITNYLMDTGIPDLAVDWIRQFIPNRYVFVLALCGFLFVAAAMMEIYAAIVVLVPLLLPLSRHYGIEPVHFGLIFLAAMEVGFLCPPAGMNIYFASAMFGKSLRYVSVSVMPAMLAILVGTLIIAGLGWL